MKWRWWIVLLVAACAALAIVTALVWPREREPEYKGRKLSAWIHGGASGKLDSADREERIEAIRHIGTNALPLLLKWIGSAGWPKPGLSKVEGAALKVMTREAGRSWLRYRSRKFYWAIDAAWAFQVLGPQASPAVPELLTLSHSTNGWIATLASGALENVKRNETPSSRDYIEDAMAAAPGRAPDSLGRQVPEKWAVGHVWRTNSKVQVPSSVKSTSEGRPEEIQDTNSKTVKTD